MSGNSAPGGGAGRCAHPGQHGRNFCVICGQPLPASSGSAETMTLRQAPAWQGPAQDYARQDYARQAQSLAGPGGPASGPRAPRWPAVAGIIVAAALLGGGAATYTLVAHPFSHPRSPAASGSNAASVTRPSAGPASPSAPAASPATASPATATSRPRSQKQAATALAGLLSRSASDRSAITRAYNDVSACGPLLGRDQQAFQQAAASRQRLISQLAGIAGASALPAAMVSDLTGAWQASERADQDYARWAGDEIAGGCTPQDYADPGYTAAEGPNQAATSDKGAFTALWDPLAQRYGLPAYGQSQI